MPVSLELRENDQVFYWVFTDPWHIADLMPLSKQARAHFDAASQKIHTIAILRQARRLPAGMLRIREFSTWDHPNSGQLAIVGAPAFGKSIMDVVGRMVDFDRMRFFETEEAAWVYVRQAIAQPNTDEG